MYRGYSELDRIRCVLLILYIVSSYVVWCPCLQAAASHGWPFSRWEMRLVLLQPGLGLHRRQPLGRRRRARRLPGGLPGGRHPRQLRPNDSQFSSLSVPSAKWEHAASHRMAEKYLLPCQLVDRWRRDAKARRLTRALAWHDVRCACRLWTSPTACPCAGQAAAAMPRQLDAPGGQGPISRYGAHGLRRQSNGCPAASGSGPWCAEH